MMTSCVLNMTRFAVVLLLAQVAVKLSFQQLAEANGLPPSKHYWAQPETGGHTSTRLVPSFRYKK